MNTDGFSIKCSNHIYITLNWNGQCLFCMDNDIIYAEEMIYKIEKRTGMKFQDISIEGSKTDFRGIRFFNGGWKRDFWEDFPNEKEIKGFMVTKYGK